MFSKVLGMLTVECDIRLNTHYLSYFNKPIWNTFSELNNIQIYKIVFFLF